MWQNSRHLSNLLIGGCWKQRWWRCQLRSDKHFLKTHSKLPSLPPRIYRWWGVTSDHTAPSQCVTINTKYKAQVDRSAVGRDVYNVNKSLSPDLKHQMPCWVANPAWLWDFPEVRNRKGTEGGLLLGQLLGQLLGFPSFRPMLVAEVNWIGFVIW